nr:succinate dehydrogenase subunit 2 [Bangiopsis subsimplex]
MLRLIRYVPSVLSKPIVLVLPYRAHQAQVVLSLLLHLRAQLDATLALRYSCREGICGSCAVTVLGRAQLACLRWLPTSASRDAVLITGLHHHALVRDLVSSMDLLIVQYGSIRPWLGHAAVGSGVLQSPAHRVLLEMHYECVLCSSCNAACPSQWWLGSSYAGPALVLQLARWVLDTRSCSRARVEWLRASGASLMLDGCSSIQSCSYVCPKGLVPSAAVQVLRLLSRSGVLRASRLLPIWLSRWLDEIEKKNDAAQQSQVERNANSK